MVLKVLKEKKVVLKVLKEKSSEMNNHSLNSIGWKAENNIKVN